MAMEVRFTALAPVERTIQIDESDMAALYDVVVNYFLSMIPYVDWDKSVDYMPEKRAVIEFAEKFGVAKNHAPSIEAFYKAALGR